MLQLLVLACAVALGTAESEAEPAAAANPVFVHQDQEQLLYGRRAHVPEDIINKQHRIIEQVYSPDYYEPTLILDYRYLKSGGRDYTRGVGGQILILPPNVHSHEQKEHRDYDSLIEFLRLRNLAQNEAKLQRHEDERMRTLHHEPLGHDRIHQLRGHEEHHRSQEVRHDHLHVPTHGHAREYTHERLQDRY